MKRTILKLLALSLCLITLFSFIPAQTASADSGDTVTIESQTNSAFDYLEYYSNGKWKDLNTPKHWIESTGQVCYCIEHTDGNAVHGETAAEVIYHRADAEKEFMGLKSFHGDRPHLRDTEIAKNYLDERELRAMGQIVSGYLDFAERQAEREIPMTMQDWAKHLDGILTATGEKFLQGAGSVTHVQAIEKAHAEYRKYQERTLSAVEQDYLDTIRQLGIKAEEKSNP